MEGYLSKKALNQSNSLFSARNWKKRWFILDGGYLTYYESFDKTKNEPINKKGVVPVIGCQVVLLTHHDRKFVFGLQHPSRKSVNLSAETEELMQIWLRALHNAVTGIMGPPSSVNFDQYYKLLELDPNDELNAVSLNKTFRKKALKTHPDKGGKVEDFKAIQEAFDMLMAKIEDFEAAKNFMEISYECQIKKGGPGVGFGMVVVEDTKVSSLSLSRAICFSLSLSLTFFFYCI